MAKKFYITTSIAYTNAPPHIGFALELVQADVLARYHRNLGEEVFFLTGTDEHGQKVLRAAEKCKKNPEDFCDEISNRFKGLKKVLNISNDDFIRTTDQKRHWPTVKKVWLELKTNDDIYKKKYQGLYCVGCEAFVKEKDLVDGKCPNHQQKPEIIEEENYFFKLSKYSSQVRKAIENEEIKIFPESKKNEILAFINQGVEDISCSRSGEKLKWGIPVPNDDSQTTYIWLEALLNYISVLGYDKDGPKFQKFWPADIHCVGKDIFRFHILLWPAILSALKLPLPKNMLVHGFITSNGQKMSKSLGNIVCPVELVKKYGTDPVRYFLLREIPPTEDGDFTYEKFEARYNSDLARGLGNLMARVITLAEKSKIQSTKFKINPKLKMQINKAYRSHKKALADFNFKEALVVIWELISFCDRYIEKERPWEKSKKQRRVIDDLLFAISEIVKLLEPFLPETSGKIVKQLEARKSETLFPRI